jgi:hypothetical protein
VNCDDKYIISNLERIRYLLNNFITDIDISNIIYTFYFDISTHSDIQRYHLSFFLGLSTSLINIYLAEIFTHLKNQSINYSLSNVESEITDIIYDLSTKFTLDKIMRIEKISKIINI